MAKFVQIGNLAFNPDLVTDIHFWSGQLLSERRVVVFFAATYDGEQASIKFESDDHTAFLAWWENVAEVYNA